MSLWRPATDATQKFIHTDVEFGSATGSSASSVVSTSCSVSASVSEGNDSGIDASSSKSQTKGISTVYCHMIVHYVEIDAASYILRSDWFKRDMGYISIFRFVSFYQKENVSILWYINVHWKKQLCQASSESARWRLMFFTLFRILEISFTACFIFLFSSCGCFMSSELNSFTVEQLFFMLFQNGPLTSYWLLHTVKINSAL